MYWNIYASNILIITICLFHQMLPHLGPCYIIPDYFSYRTDGRIDKVDTTLSRFFYYGKLP